MPQDESHDSVLRHRPALLVATVVGAVITIGSLLAGMGPPMMFGVFLFLGCGFIYLATVPAK